MPTLRDRASPRARTSRCLNRLAAVVACLCLAAAGAARAEPARPNVLLVLADDLGYGDLGVHGTPHIETPRLDRLAAESVRFDRFFVTPLCAPTRAALLTGRSALRTGVWGIKQHQETMSGEEVTLAEALRGAGYRTGCFGKWHNGELHPTSAPGQGFDEFFGFYGGHVNDYFDARLTRGTTPEPTTGYIADVLTDAAIDFMERHRDRPFFCYVPFNTPHTPVQAPDREFAAAKAKGLSDSDAGFDAMCANLDANVGRLLDAVDRLRLAPDTIVLFLSDNGAAATRFNAGMKGLKSGLDEGGSRVPLFVRWPGRLGPPRAVPQIAAVIDLFPTLLDLCGVPAPPGPPVDGISLRPLLEGRPVAGPERLLFTNWSGRPAAGAVRSPRYRLVSDGGRWRLYDMLADPGQETDVAAAHPDEVARLRAAYETWFADVTAGFSRAPRPLPVGHAEHDPVVLTAPLATFTGRIRFEPPQGVSHSWLTGWTDPADTIRFDLDVAAPGSYEVALRYACPQADAGATVRVRAGAATVSGTVPAFAGRELPLPHRTTERHEVFRNREWGVLELGRLRLDRGPTQLTVEAVDKPGASVLDLKEVVLRRAD
jgi:arylsulfatase A-like enzyme